jgi:hypothetical protein
MISWPDRPGNDDRNTLQYGLPVEGEVKLIVRHIPFPFIQHLDVAAQWDRSYGKFRTFERLIASRPDVDIVRRRYWLRWRSTLRPDRFSKTDRKPQDMDIEAPRDPIMTILVKGDEYGKGHDQCRDALYYFYHLPVLTPFSQKTGHGFSCHDPC